MEPPWRGCRTQNERGTRGLDRPARLLYLVQDVRERPTRSLLESRGVSVWFSENDIGLGEPFLRAIDKGLAKSRIGIVLVTPALLKRLPAAGVADKELSVLLARDQLVPIVHNTTYEALREVSPMLASRNGLDIAEMSLADAAAKLAELVTVLDIVPV